MHFSDAALMVALSSNFNSWRQANPVGVFNLDNNYEYVSTVASVWIYVVIHSR